MPPRKDEPYVVPLNGFGLPIEAMGVLRDIGLGEPLSRRLRYRRQIKHNGGLEILCERRHRRHSTFS